MNLGEVVVIYLLAVFSEGEKSGLVFIGSLVLSHQCLTHLSGC